MYLIMSQVPGGEVLDSLGFDADEPDTRPMVFMEAKDLLK